MMNKLDTRMIRSFINGEVPGARKMLLLAFLSIFMWAAVLYYSSSTARLEQSYGLQSGRLVTLNELAAQYRQLMGERGANIRTAAADLIPVFSQIVEEAGMRDRLLQISPVARGGISVQMDRLYAEDVAAILKGLNSCGILVLSSELRAMPFQDKRLFSFFAVLGAED